MMRFFTHKLGRLDNLVYILANQNRAVFVDPANGADALLATIRREGLTPVGIILTHSHFDHIDAIPEILAVYPDLPIYVTQIETTYERFNIQSDHIHFIKDTNIIELADLSIHVIETPGHTLGSVCFYVDHHLFAGDTIFVNGIGRCDFHDSDVDAMYHSVNKIRQLGLPEDTIVHPGHDYGSQPDDTLGNQYQSNPYFLIEDPAFFSQVRMRLQPLFHRIPFQPRTKTEVDFFMEQQR